MQNNFSIEMNAENFKPVHSFIENATLDGIKTLRVVKDPKIIAVDEPTYARLLDIEFQDGTIELKVLSRLLPDAPDYARGFIGVAFRINDADDQFESIYIRPTNGRNENQSRRNAATQYFSYPDYKFDRFRAECPGRYESYADMGLDEWISFKIVVEGEHARLYLHDFPQPVLVVNDLKHGADSQGGVALWVEVGTEGFFKDLKITTL